MTTYTEARYNRVQHQLEEAGFRLHLLELDEPVPRAVYRVAAGLPQPEVRVYPLEQSFRIITDEWQLSMNLDVPASVVKAALESAAAQVL